MEECWLRDPSLYIEYHDGMIKLWRLHGNFQTPLIDGPDYSHIKDVTDYLDLVDHSFPWMEDDWCAFKDFLSRYDIIVSCQGLVLSITYPQQKENNNQTGGTSKRFRSIEVVDLSRYGLPAPLIPSQEVQYSESGESPVKSSSKGNELQVLHEQLKEEKKAKEALEKQVDDLERKLKSYRRSLEPWMSYSAVLDDWVSYEELVIHLNFRRPPGRAYVLVETLDSADEDEDDTTNIQPNQFYRALMDGLESMMELIVVKIDKLTPNNQKAKFKPDVWFKFDNAGEIFAAREPTQSEKEFNF